MVYACKAGRIRPAGSLLAGGVDRSWMSRRHPTTCAIRPLSFKFQHHRILGRVLVVDSPLKHTTVWFHAVFGWGSGDERHWHGAVRNGRADYTWADGWDTLRNVEVFAAQDW